MNLWDALWQPVNCVANLGAAVTGKLANAAVGIASDTALFVQCVVTNMQGLI